MTPEELVNTHTALRDAWQIVRQKVALVNALIEEVGIVIDRSSPLSLPLTQAETDHIVAVYTPLYLNAATAVELATDALGIDVLNK